MFKDDYCLVGYQAFLSGRNWPTFEWCLFMSMGWHLLTEVTKGPLFYPRGDTWIWSPGGVTLTGKKWRTQTETSPCVNSSATNSTWTDQGPNAGLRCNKPVPNRLTHGTGFWGVLTESIIRKSMTQTAVIFVLAAVRTQILAHNSIFINRIRFPCDETALNTALCSVSLWSSSN